jgi:hypothetical protein
MKTIHDDDVVSENYSPEIDLEIGGRPSWFSYCDDNKLVYTGKSLFLN